MPQMSPIMWLTLFLFFSTLMLMTFTKIYFNLNLKTKNNKMNKTMMMMNNIKWMW